MSKLFICLSVLSFCTGLLSGQTILPTPEKTEILKDTLRIKDSRAVVYPNSPDAPWLPLLRQALFPGTPLTFSRTTKKADIRFITDSTCPEEAYRLLITPHYIEVRAGGAAGFIHSIQTLQQWGQRDEEGGLKFGCVNITDCPRTSWRSFLLDSGRQYQSVGTIKKYIEMASMLKMNYFHWHLTEGLGWRLEIKRYPMLTQKGAFVGTGEQQQGFYSQEEVGEIIRYAAERGITVVPEIDMPGHAEAALSAYPELGCFGQAVEIPKIGFTKNIFCAGKDSTLQFLRNVLDEVCKLFPSPYIHLGGDEAPKENWDKCPDCQKRIAGFHLSGSHDLQSWLAAQMAQYLKEKGRKAIFWGDILYKEGYPLPEGTIIQWWNFRGHKYLALQNALRRGHPVICTPNYYTYLNFPLTPWRGYGKERTFDLKDTYCNNPAYKATLLPNPLIWGMGSAMWTDDGVTEQMIDRRLFPRILALAEQMWHRGELPDFDTFYRHIMRKKAWFEEHGYEFGPALTEEVPGNYKWD